eukprot:6691137-Prymnesium_polylepis.2
MCSARVRAGGGVRARCPPPPTAADDAGTPGHTSLTTARSPDSASPRVGRIGVRGPESRDRSPGSCVRPVTMSAARSTETRHESHAAAGRCARKHVAASREPRARLCQRESRSRTSRRRAALLEDCRTRGVVRGGRGVQQQRACGSSRAYSSEKRPQTHASLLLRMTTSRRHLAVG